MVPLLVMGADLARAADDAGGIVDESATSGNKSAGLRLNDAVIGEVCAVEKDATAGTDGKWCSIGKGRVEVKGTAGRDGEGGIVYRAAVGVEDSTDGEEIGGNARAGGDGDLAVVVEGAAGRESHAGSKRNVLTECRVGIDCEAVEEIEGAAGPGEDGRIAVEIQPADGECSGGEIDG